MSERAYRIDRKEWRRRLKEAGLTQGQLAARVGMHQNSLSRKIRGKRDITLEEFIRIAFELGVSIPLTFANDDVANVVRCKDCVWWNEDDSAGWGDLGNNVCACIYFSNEDGYTVYTEPNDYCSKGLRMEDEG